MEYNDGVDSADLSVLPADSSRTVVTTLYHKTVQSVATSEEAVVLGDVATKGACMLVNLDPTNFISVKTATSGTIFAKLFPRGSGSGLNFCILHLGSGAQAPFVIADTAACRMAILLINL